MTGFVCATALAWRVRALWPALPLLLGMAWAQVLGCITLCAPFPEVMSGTDLMVEGRIVSLPGRLADGHRFLFQVDRMEQQGQRTSFNGLVQLSWYRDAEPVRAGDAWRLQVRLKPPHGFANPGGFDYERWLFLQGVRATGYIRSGDHNRRLPARDHFAPMQSVREGIRGHIRSTVMDSRGAALLQALTLGDRSGLTPADWEVLTRTGTNHLIAISGLHIGLVAGLVFLLVGLTWKLSAIAVSAMAAPRAAAIGAFTAALAYSVLAGFAVSTQRALIMLVVVLGAVLWRRSLRPFGALALALLGVLAVDPQAVLSYGFWLSFGAVGILLYGLGRRLPNRSLWWRWGRAQWVVAVGLVPMVLMLFDRASIVAPLVNLLAVPLFSLVLLPLVLLATLISQIPGLDAPLILIGSLLSWCFGLLEVLSEQPWVSMGISARPDWVWGSAGVAVLLLLAPRGIPGRWLGLVLLLPLVLVRPASPPDGEVWLTLLDVGQGLSVVVRTRDHTLVYDLGPAYPSGFNTGSVVVLPFLRQQGVEHIDTLVLSHADRDHAGGLVGLRDRIGIGEVLSGESGEITGVDAAACRAGRSWIWDGVGFEVLHPDGPGLRGNDSSCVLRLQVGDVAVLLPGDIRRRVEGELIQRFGRRLRSDILVAAHHGSDTSSSPDWLAAVSPGFVLYASGFANRFGLPSPAVRERVRGMGAVELDTGECGAIGFRLSAAGISEPDLQRLDARRLWTHLPPGACVWSRSGPMRFGLSPPLPD